MTPPPNVRKQEVPFRAKRFFKFHDFVILCDLEEAIRDQWESTILPAYMMTMLGAVDYGFLDGIVGDDPDWRTIQKLWKHICLEANYDEQGVLS